MTANKRYTAHVANDLIVHAALSVSEYLLESLGSTMIANKLQHVGFAEGFSVAEQFTISLSGDHPSPAFRVEAKYPGGPNDHVIQVAVWGGQVIDSEKFIREPLQDGRRFLTASWLTYLPDSPRTCAINQNLSLLLVRLISNTFPRTKVLRGEKKHKKLP